MILALLPPDERLLRLRSAVRGPGDVVPCATWSEVTAACERGDVEGVVFDLYADGSPDFERLRGLRARAPRAAMIAYVDPGRARLRDAFDAGRCGVEAFVVWTLGYTAWLFSLSWQHGPRPRWQWGGRSPSQG